MKLLGYTAVLAMAMLSSRSALAQAPVSGQQPRVVLARLDSAYGEQEARPQFCRQLAGGR